MSIEKIGSTLESVPKRTTENIKNIQPRVYQRGATDGVSFTGMGTKEIEKIIKDHMLQKKAIEAMGKFEGLKGELGGILITAVGTGTVAPIFIGFNPFVRAPKNATEKEKEDLKNTKEYTAMRQPVSAALAILFQASVQKYIDKFLDTIFNHPDRAKFQRFNLNRSKLNTDTYIKAQIIEEMKKEGKNKPSIFDSSEIRKAYEDDLKTRVKARQDKQLQDVANEFFLTKEIKIGDQKLSTSELAELLNQNIESYRKDCIALQKNEDKIAKNVAKADILINNEGRIKEIFKDIPINDIIETKKALRDESLSELRKTELVEKLQKAYATAEQKITKDFLTKLHEAETQPEIKSLIRECLIQPDDLKANHAIRILERIESINNMCKGDYSAEKYRNALIKRNAVLTDRSVRFLEAKIKDTKNVTQDVIKDTFDKIADICKFNRDGSIIESVLCDTDVFGHKEKDIKEKLAKDVAKAYKKLVEHNFKSWNQIAKICVGVFITLPITCTALNWVYPRFMEIFFPKLAGVKKNAGAQPPQQANKTGGEK